MDAQGTEQTSAPVESANVADSTPTVDTSTPVAASTPVEAGSTPAADPAAPQYTPDYKFKVMDKDHEIDDFLRPAIKSKEHEQKIKEMYEKAFGIDEVKKSRDTVRDEYKNYKGQTEPVVNTVMQASQLYQAGKQALEQGNPRSFVFKTQEAFKQMGIPDQILQKYVFEKLKLEELPPEQRNEYTRQEELERQNATLQQQSQQQLAQYQALALQTRQAELNQVISKPEISSIVQQFDQRNGQGAFVNEVWMRGRLHAQTYNQDLSAEQVVQEIINKYGLQNSSPIAQPQAVKKAVPVIPVVKGGNTSPAQRSIRSIADLEKAASEKRGY